MGVYIKNVELPRHDDEYVIFTVYGDGGVVYGPLNRPHVRYKDRAVPVPPHGDLIDRDALRAEVKKHATPSDAWVFSLIRTAPTVIPAEPFNNLSKPCKDDDDIPICTKASPSSRGIYKKAEEGE